LPYNSKLNVNTGWSSATSKTDLSSLTADSLSGTVTSNKLTFDGRVDTQNFDVALTTNPVKFLDGNIFYKYYNRDNKSDVITSTVGTETFVNSPLNIQRIKWEAKSASGFQ